jgi:hypothetical protein
MIGIKEGDADVNHEQHAIHALSSTDAEYRFGRPKVYLAAHELVRLTILRSKLGDTHAERIARAAGLPRQRAVRGAAMRRRSAR